MPGEEYVPKNYVKQTIPDKHKRLEAAFKLISK
jgi:hypothetical protein